MHGKGSLNDEKIIYKVFYTMQVESLHTMEIGKKINFKDKVPFIMKLHFNLTMSLISEILIMWKSKEFIYI
jgi:hypothetical protein